MAVFCSALLLIYVFVLLPPGWVRVIRGELRSQTGWMNVAHNSKDPEIFKEQFPVTSILESGSAPVHDIKGGSGRPTVSLRFLLWLMTGLVPLCPPQGESVVGTDIYTLY